MTRYLHTYRHRRLWKALQVAVLTTAVCFLSLSNDVPSPAAQQIDDPSIASIEPEEPAALEAPVWEISAQEPRSWEESLQETPVEPTAEAEPVAGGETNPTTEEDEATLPASRAVVSSRGGARPAASPPKPSGDDIAAVAMKYLGYPYGWAGSSPRTGFDCSGFVWYVCQEAGISVPNHDLAGQMRSGQQVAPDQLQRGDLVFFKNTYLAGLSHGGIYLGAGRFIHAVDESQGVQISNIGDGYWSPRYLGASRPTAR